jgi:DNA processing protein
MAGGAEGDGRGRRLTDAQRLDWLRLIRSEGVGPRTFRSLVNHFGGAAAALEGLPGLARKRGARVKICTADEARREMEAAARMGVRIVAAGEPGYPSALAVTDTAPPLLMARGALGACARPMVAVVGSRNASGAGLRLTERIARGAGEAGFVVVSGLARGIDAQAHEAALPTGTVAVLAGGHDRLYPPEHAGLLERILERGAVLTEMPMGWEPRGRDFPRRNRIVAGAALGTVLVEAARRSGSLITARFAGELGRELLCVPGSPLDPRSDGTNALIREGATLVRSADDVVEALAPLVGRDPPARGAMRDEPGRDEPLWEETDFLGEGAAAPPQAPPETDGWAESAAAPELSGDARILALLGAAPVSVDDLVRAAHLPVQEVHLALFDLQAAGKIERHEGGLVSRRDPRA